MCGIKSHVNDPGQQFDIGRVVIKQAGIERVVASMGVASDFIINIFSFHKCPGDEIRGPGVQ
jgi:hypothetical protein